MNPGEPTIRLTPADAEAVGRVLYRAFDGDPFWSYVVPPSPGQAAGLRRLWRALATYALACGEVRATPAVDGIACWMPPGRGEMTPLAHVRSRFALPLAMLRLDPASRRRARATAAYEDDVHKRLMPEPHWYLLALAVDPEMQGQGIGSRLIAPTLARADEGGLPCYLETHRESNVAFYSKRGFELAHEGTAPGHSMRFWAMVRRPAR